MPTPKGTIRAREDVDISLMFITPKEKQRHIRAAEEALSKVGVTFDTKAYLDDDGEVCRIWYFDNSLKGPVRKRSKVRK